MKYLTGILLICVAVNLSGYSQIPNKLRFKHFNIDNGLSHNVILSIYQDSKGFLWIGTRDGLNRYDGHSIKTYSHNPADENSLSDNVISCIYEDSKKNVWLGVPGFGLELYNRAYDHFIHFSADSIPLNSTDILCLYEDSNGDFWIGTQQGLTKFNYLTGNSEHIPFNEEELSRNALSSAAIFDIFEDSEQRFWIGTYNGLNLLDRSDLTVKHYFPAAYSTEISANNWIRSIIESWDGKLWLGTNQGFKIFDIENKVFSDGFSELNESENPLTRINDITVDDEGNYWFAAWDGLCVFDAKTNAVQLITPDENDPESLSNKAITSLFKDKSGGIWIGTWNGGINYFNKSFNKFNLYRRNPGKQSISGNIVRAIITDHKNNLYLGIDQGGLNYFNRSANTFDHLKNISGNNASLVHDNIRCLEWKNKDQLWIGTQDGLDLFNTQSKSFVRFASFFRNNSGIAPNDIWCLITDYKNLLWIGTRNGLFIYNTETYQIQKYTSEGHETHLLSSNYIYSLFEDHQRNIWIGTDDGLNLYLRKKDRFKHIEMIGSNKSLLSNNRVISIYEDSRKRLWIGTHGGGLCMLQKEDSTFINFRQKDGLPNEVIYGILEDNDGDLWLSTNHGISKFNPDELTFKNYDIHDGLQSNQFYFNAYHKSETGEMFFGGVNGFNSFFPDEIKENTVQPEVCITSLKIFNQEAPISSANDNEGILDKHIIETEEITLKHEHSVVSFEFTALHFAQPIKNKYAYKLEGFEDDWNYVGNRRTATYTNLEAGEYIFKVKASNNDGIWNETGTALYITVLPPWWETWWFRIILAAVILVILYLMGQLIRNKEKLKSNLKLERIEAEKAREIDSMKLKFFSNISHELRTPLTLIIGPVEKLIKKSGIPEELQHQYQIMHKNAHRLLRLINQLLDLNKIEAGYMRLQVSQADIVKHIRTIASAFDYRSEKHCIEFSVNSETSEFLCYFDPDKIEKILYNLLSNAFKFTPDQGKISVHISCFQKEYQQTKDVDYIKIKVIDNGKGIPGDQLQKVFEGFYQIENSEKDHLKGTGIGLTLTKQLTEIHKGFLKVESEVGKGTTFSVHIPVSKEIYSAEEICEPNSESIKEALPDKVDETISDTENEENIIANKDLPLILIIDDNQDIRNYIKSHLKGNYQIEEAENGKEGLERAFKLIPDLIVSDIMMPEINGIELCSRLKKDEKTNHIPIIILTAKPGNDSKISGLEAGAEDYIIKPFQIEELQLKIRNLIEIREKIKKAFRNTITLLPKEIDIPSLDAKFIQKAIGIVEKNMDNPEFGISAFYKEIGVSRMQLYRKIQAITGQTVKEFVRNIRLERAAQLLTKQELTVNEIAYMSGFKELSYFRKCFKEKYKMSPTEYANQNI